MLNQKFVLLDIDGTLFNAIAFRFHFVKKICEDLKLNHAEFKDQEYALYKDIVAERGFFDPKYYLSKLFKNLKEKISMAVLENYFFNAQMSDYFYPEVEQFINHLSKIAEIGILSKGDLSFQKSKIKSIDKFLKPDQIYISEKKVDLIALASQNLKHKKVYLIDDKLYILETAKKEAATWTTMLIESTEANNEHLSYNYIPDFKITKLDQALSIILNE